MSAVDAVVMGLQAAESDALKQGAVPGYTLMAHGALEGLKYAGYAVIELPKRVDGHWPVDPDDDEFHVCRITLSRGGVYANGARVSLGSVELNLHGDHARALAAALLAAADVEESGS
jgi:hypothetical protein